MGVPGQGLGPGLAGFTLGPVLQMTRGVQNSVLCVPGMAGLVRVVEMQRHLSARPDRGREGGEGEASDP
jgi:hypothetical protein